MNDSKYHPLGNTVRLLLIAILAITLTVSTGQTAQAFASPAPVDLGAAAPFAILTKSGITTTGPTAITGNIGVSPIVAASMTGFGLIADSTNTFSTSPGIVTGKIYASNYAAPTPANMTTAISNMETAYTDAAGRTLPDATELGSGDISGLTIAPGLYKWGTGVSINTDVTLAGSATDIWIFQISGNLTVASAAKVLLSGGAKASNIFWQVGGGVGVEIGTTAHVEGTILAVAGINLQTGASLNGRALSQTAVTLDANTVVLPTPFVLDSLCNMTTATSMDFTVNFPQSVTGVDASDFTLTTTGLVGASIGVVSGSGTSWTVLVSTGTGNGTIRLDMNASGTGIVDAVTGDPVSGGFISGNICKITKSTLTVLSSVRVNTETTSLASVGFTVTFSEAVTGVDKNDFKLMNTFLTGASVTNVVPVSTSVYTVTVNTGTGNGTIRLDVPPLTATIENIIGEIVNPYTGGQTYIINKGSAPTVPVLVSPLTNTLVLGYMPTLNWNDSSQVMALALGWHYEINVTAPLMSYDQMFNTVDNADPLVGLGASEYTFLTPLAANTTFYWKVRAYNDNNQYSAWSLTRSFRTSLETPTLLLPANAVAPALSTLRPTFTWTAVSGATSYTIQILKGITVVRTGIVAAATPTYTSPVNLSASTTYTWKVKANGVNAGVYSALPFTFTSTILAPMVPVLFAPAANALVDSTVPQTLDWNPVLASLNTPAAANYDVEYANNSAFTGSTLANVVAPITQLIVAPILDFNTTYYWRVRSCNALGDHSAWSLVRTFRTRLATPVLNLPVDASIENNKRPTFSWDEVPGATTYTLQILKGTSVVVTGTIKAPAYTYTPVKDLIFNTAYTWRVMANGVNISVYSKAFTFNTSALNPSATPVLYAPANGAVLANNVAQVLDWNASLGLPAAVGYEVEYATNSAFIGSTVSAPVAAPTTALTVSTLPGRTYYWRVRSLSAAGNQSSWSLARMINVKFVVPTLTSPINGVTGVGDKPTFTWNSGTNGLWTSYTLYVANNVAFSSGLRTFTINAPTTTYTIPNSLPALSVGLKYWRVRINGLYFPIFSAEVTPVNTFTP